MSGKYFLGIDVGTSSIKAVVIDEKATPVANSSSHYRLITPSQNEIQIDTESLWEAVLKSVKLCLRNVPPENIEGIGISSLCPGLAAFGEQGEVLVDPIIYSDRRSIEEAETIKQAVGEDAIFAITANNVMAGAISGTSMLWIKRHLPELYQKTKYFGHINTLLTSRMTGNFAIDYSNASYTALFETTKGYAGGWSEELCEKIGIDREKLPPLMASSDIVGGLINGDMLALGLREGVSVVIGGGDTACATFASGVTKSGDVCESVGTTNVLTICVDQPKFDKSFINRCHVVDNTWIYQGALSHTGSSYQWFRDNMCQDLVEKSGGSEKKAFQMMDEEAIGSNPGSDGVVFLPYMLGGRSPIWDPYARGVFFGLSLYTKRSDLIRAIMEGCGYGLRQLCEIAEKVTGNEIKEFTSIGGGAKSEVWAQIKADITGRKINVLDLNDMAPVGAALLAAVGTKNFDNKQQAADAVKKCLYREVECNTVHQDVYDKRHRVYVELYPRIKELYKISQI